MQSVESYQTIDGMIFSDKKEAEQHELELLNVKVFKVSYSPDVTEGYGLMRSGYLLVHAKRNHQMFAEDWCFKQFGNRIEFCQGVFGSNAIMDAWRISPCDSEAVKPDQIIGKIEEKFVKPIWADANKGLIKENAYR